MGRFVAGGDFDLARELSAWFARKAPEMASKAEKLAFMDATFRALPMQYSGADRSVAYVGPAAQARRHEVATYDFGYRKPRSRLTNYARFSVQWLVDPGLQEFSSVTDKHSTEIFGRTLKRARYAAQPLCPQAASQADHI